MGEWTAALLAALACASCGGEDDEVYGAERAEESRGDLPLEPMDDAPGQPVPEPLGGEPESDPLREPPPDQPPPAEPQPEPPAGPAEGTPPEGAESEEEPAFGTAADVQRAAEMWTEMSGYRAWSAPPGMEGWHEAQGPHGPYVRVFVNHPAAGALDAPPDGSVLVKENCSEEDEATLSAITAMKKVTGYDAEHGDWFWVKYGPDGEVLENEEGTPLAGRVALGSDQGCIACHDRADGDDYVFSNDG